MQLALCVVLALGLVPLDGLCSEPSNKAMVPDEDAQKTAAAQIGEIYKPDVAVLPVGDHFTMGPREASHAVRLLGVKHVLGSHWGTFDALTGTPDQLEAELAALGLGDVTVHALAPGDSL